MTVGPTRRINLALETKATPLADTGVANAYAVAVITSTVSPGSYFAGMVIMFTAAHTNTGASTMNVTSVGSPLGAVPIKKQGGTADVAAGDIQAGAVIALVHDGSNFQMLSALGNPATNTAGVTVDGGGSTPLTGSKGFIQAPYDCTISKWSLVADQAGSCQVTVKKCSDSAFPSTASIVASAPPAISSQQKAESSILTGWTTAVSTGDWLEFNLDSITTITRLTLQLTITRS